MDSLLTTLLQAPAGAVALNPMIIGLSILVGLSTTIILFCSHFHQVGRRVL